MLITLALYLSGIACIAGAGYFTGVIQEYRHLYGISPLTYLGPLWLTFMGIMLILNSVPA